MFLRRLARHGWKIGRVDRMRMHWLLLAQMVWYWLLLVGCWRDSMLFWQMKI